MIPRPEQSSKTFTAEMPALPLDGAGLFWLNPHAVQKVDKLINSTHLSTMSMGVETHADEHLAARQQMADILIPEADPLARDLQRALDIGFMYGGLIARTSHATKPESAEAYVEEAKENYNEPLPEELAAGLMAAQAGLDLSSANDNYLLFRRLRSIEVGQAGSDILAFSLAATQDHMGTEFDANRLSAEPLTQQQKRRLQSFYYAGALAGGLLASDSQDLSKDKVEIMRSTYGAVEPISVRAEFEPGDDIAHAAEYLLASKLSFYYVNNGFEEPYVSVLPSGIQFGPNALSVPIYLPQLEEPEMMYRAPIRDIEGLIISRSNQETGLVEKFQLVEDVPGYFEDQEEDSSIVALLLPGACVSSYHSSHPNAQVISALAAKSAGKGDDNVRRYTFELTPIEWSGWSVNQKLGAWALGSLSAIWSMEALEYALMKDESINWSSNLTLSALVLAGAGILAYAKNTLKRVGREHDADYQQLLDQYTLPK